MMKYHLRLVVETPDCKIEGAWEDCSEDFPLYEAECYAEALAAVATGGPVTLKVNDDNEVIVPPGILQHSLITVERKSYVKKENPLTAKKTVKATSNVISFSSKE